MPDKSGDLQVPLWAGRLRRDRQARQLSVADAAKQLRLHASSDDAKRFPDEDSVVRRWRHWESGQTTTPDEFYQRPIAKMFGSVPAAYFPQLTQDKGIIVLTDDQLAELMQRLRHSDVDQASMDALRNTVDRLCTDYASKPASVVLADAATWLGHVNLLLERRVTLAQHCEALTMAGWLTLLVSCLRYDLDDDRGAEGARLEAVNAAREVDNPEIAAWASEIKAWMALTRGDYYTTIAAAQEGLAATTRHGVAVQLHAQAAKAWARIRNRDQAIIELEEGRALLGRLGYPANPRNHFEVDPTKYDFYAMDCWRLTGEDALAQAAAETVIRTSIAPDGRQISPMRLAEAELTQAALLARGGDFDGAVEHATRALSIDRQSLPDLLLAAREVSEELQRIRPADRTASDFAQHINQLAAATQRRATP